MVICQITEKVHVGGEEAEVEAVMNGIGIVIVKIVGRDVGKDVNKRKGNDRMNQGENSKRKEVVGNIIMIRRKITARKITATPQ